MRDQRRHRRTSVAGLAARVLPGPTGHEHGPGAPGEPSLRSGRPGARHPVLNVSESGMLVTGLALPVGRPVTFTLEGGGLRCTGRGHVVYCRGPGCGVAVDRWFGPAEAIRAIGARRSRPEPRAERYLTDWT